MNKIDKKLMFKTYDKWPEIAKNSFKKDYQVIDLKDINHIVFVGMGGSGTLGDVFGAILSKTKIHVTVVKGYVLPNTIDENTLVVFTSVSGNTVETLSALQSTKGINCKVISFSSGGLLEKYCLDNSLDYRKILENHSPRASFVTYLYSMLKILKQVLPLENSEILNSISNMEKMSHEINSSLLNENNLSLKLAKNLKDIPIIYYPAGLQSVAIRFKNCLQENAKMHAMTEDVVESSHNGIVAWENPSNVYPILIQGNDDHLKTKERWKILKEYFIQNQIKFDEVFSIEGDILSKIVSLIYFLDYTSIYKAILSNIDPSPVKSVDFIKGKLK